MNILRAREQLKGGYMFEGLESGALKLPYTKTRVNFEMISEQVQEWSDAEIFYTCFAFNTMVKIPRGQEAQFLINLDTLLLKAHNDFTDFIAKARKEVEFLEGLKNGTP